MPSDSSLAASSSPPSLKRSSSCSSPRRAANCAKMFFVVVGDTPTRSVRQVGPPLTPSFKCCVQVTRRVPRARGVTGLSAPRRPRCSQCINMRSYLQPSSGHGYPPSSGRCQCSPGSGGLRKFCTATAGPLWGPTPSQSQTPPAGTPPLRRAAYSPSAPAWADRPLCLWPSTLRARPGCAHTRTAWPRPQSDSTHPSQA